MSQTLGRKLLGLLLALLYCATIAAQEADVEPRVHRGDRVSVFGGTIRIDEDEIRHGSVVCVACGGVEVEGDVRGQVVVVFGSLEMTGRARDGVVGVLSDLRLDGADVGQQLINVLGTLKQHDIEVNGQTVNIGLGDWLPGFGLWGGSIFELTFWWQLLDLLGVFVTLLLLVVLLPDRIRTMADEAPARYASSFFVGLLSYAVYPLVLLLLVFTLVGAPVWYFGFKVLKWLGGAALLYLLGRRLARVGGREMSLAGGVFLGFLVYAFLSLLPLFFGVIGFLLGLVLSSFLFLFIQVPAIGLVVLTRAGTRTLAPPTISPPGPPADPPAPPSAAPAPG